MIGSSFLACLFLARFAVHTTATDQIGRTPNLFLPPDVSQDGSATQPPIQQPGELEFELRHIYQLGGKRYPDVHRYLDISADALATVESDDAGARAEVPRSLQAKAITTDVQRLVDRNRTAIDGLLDYSLIHGQAAYLPSSSWRTDTIAAPDISDKSTLITLAWMAANAYVEEPYTGDWHDVGAPFNVTDDFGWQNDGLRGHVFATKDNGTIVVGLKGTSPALFDGDDTTGNDKLNDNLFGSCCCAQGGHLSWKIVCDCMTSAFTCNQTCLVQALRKKSAYYRASQDLYHNVTARYPDSNVWMSGHSLGGVLSTLVGLTYGHPVVTFEAYPDAMAANRLGLPTPPGYRVGSHQARSDVAIHHIGHTADPIYMGQCHSTLSWCSIGGYAFESACHTGKKCTYDTVNDKSWRMGIGYHKIFSVIKDVIEAYDTVANCTHQLDCVDCYNWKFYESNGTETTTSASSKPTSTYTRTRTETCKTPGWWGCLDETTTTSSTTSAITTTTSTSTSTCQTPGWFGCNDPTTTTSATSSSRSASPGPTITTVTTTTTTMPPSSSTTCTTRGWLGGCKDATATTSTTSVPPSSRPTPSSLPSTRRKYCVRRYWFGLCREWSWKATEPKGDL